MTARPDRTDDEILLRVIAMRRDGLTVRDISGIMGWSPLRQRVEVNAVIAADLAESGECAGAVRAAYGLPA